MEMKHIDRQKRTSYLDAFAESTEYCDPITALLKGARAEAMADAAVKYSTRMDLLASHIANEGFSAAAIVELLRQESEQFARGGLQGGGL